MASKLTNVWNEGLTGYYGQLLKTQAAAKFRLLTLPEKAQDWQPELLRERIWEAMGVHADHALPLNLEITGEIACQGYRVQKICYQSRPDFYVTGNLYIPDGEGPFPAVINMHGHWSQGRLAARVQQRGHLLAKCGYVCLCVDAFGSGERATRHGEFEYHGNNLGGSLLQLGETLMGVQVVDNMRGVDLLCSLPFVNATKIGATGGSGGGNQTMWLAAMDTRITAAVPVVSVGSFQSYVMCLNCICEALPTGLTFTEESGILALVAPRALKMCNGLQDCNPAFAPAEMLRSLREARKVYHALGVPDHLDCYIFNKPHGFWPDVQEEMLGWFELHLKNKGTGRSCDLPAFDTLSEEEVMVFAKGQRPAKVCSIAEYLTRKAGEILAIERHPEREQLEKTLRLQNTGAAQLHVLYPSEGWQRFGISAADGRLIPILLRPPLPGQELVIVSAPFGKADLEKSKLYAELSQAELGLAVIDLWGCGENETSNTPETPDRCFARSLLWLGMTLQGKWVQDYQLAERFLSEMFPDNAIAAAGLRDSAISAILFAALSSKPVNLYLEQAPSSLQYSPKRAAAYTQSMLIPDILKCADIPELLKMAGGKIHSIDPIE
jgi:hypothetical protein